MGFWSHPRTWGLACAPHHATVCDMGKKRKKVNPYKEYADKEYGGLLPNIYGKDFTPEFTLPKKRLPSRIQRSLLDFLCCKPDFDQPSPITRNIYLGDEEDASNAFKLQQLGIGYIINATLKEPKFPDEFEYLNVPVHDKPGEDISAHFEKACKFIRKVLLSNIEENKILIHCKAGVSRSVSICAAYMMMVEGIQLHAAMEWIQNQRPIIAPNDGFKLQLAKFEVKLFLSSSIVRSSGHRWSGYDLNKLKQKWKSIEMPAGIPNVHKPCCALM